MNEHLIYFAGRYGSNYSTLTHLMDTAIYIYDDQVTTAAFKMNVANDPGYDYEAFIRSGDVTQIDDTTVIYPFTYMYEYNGTLRHSYHCVICAIEYTLVDGLLSSPIKTEAALTSDASDRYYASSVELMDIADQWRYIVVLRRIGDSSHAYPWSVNLEVTSGVTFGTGTSLGSAVPYEFTDSKALKIAGSNRGALISRNSYAMVDYGGVAPIMEGIVTHNENISLSSVKPAGKNKYYYDNWFSAPDGQKAMLLSSDGVRMLREGGAYADTTSLTLYNADESMFIGVFARDSSIRLAKYPFTNTVRNRIDGNISGIAIASAKSGKRVIVYEPE